MGRCTIVMVLAFTTNFFGQQLSGIIIDEDQNPLSTVLVFNVKTEQKTHTNSNGEFTIQAMANDELRFIKKGFERSSKILNHQDYTFPIRISLVRSVHEIEEVKIAHQPTGDLNKDLKNYGDTKLVAKMKLETAEYIRAESSPEVLAPKPGEFVQPAGQGLSFGSIKDQWDDVDFMGFLIDNIAQDFFTDELHLENSQIQPFIYYIFRNFSRKEILFRGVCTQYDLSRFMKECYLKIESYRLYLPYRSPKKKK